MLSAHGLLQAFINENFSEPVLLERHDLAIRYRLSRETPLAEVFRTLEEAKVSLGLEEYGVCQVRSTHKPTAAYFLACSAAGAGCADLAGADIQRLRSSTGRGDGRGALTREPPPLLSSATDGLLMVESQVRGMVRDSASAPPAVGASPLSLQQ